MPQAADSDAWLAPEDLTGHRRSAPVAPSPQRAPPPFSPPVSPFSVTFSAPPATSEFSIVFFIFFFLLLLPAEEADNMRSGEVGPREEREEGDLLEAGRCGR